MSVPTQGLGSEEYGLLAHPARPAKPRKARRSRSVPPPLGEYRHDIAGVVTPLVRPLPGAAAVDSSLGDWTEAELDAVTHVVPTNARPQPPTLDELFQDLHQRYETLARGRVALEQGRAARARAVPAPEVLVKPYWAISSLCLAVSALTAVTCLAFTGGLPGALSVFLVLFGLGLGVSSLGLLITTPTHRPED